MNTKKFRRNFPNKQEKEKQLADKSSLQNLYKKRLKTLINST